MANLKVRYFHRTEENYQKCLMMPVPCWDYNTKYLLNASQTQTENVWKQFAQRSIWTKDRYAKEATKDTA